MTTGTRSIYGAEQRHYTYKLTGKLPQKVCVTMATFHPLHTFRFAICLSPLPPLLTVLRSDQVDDCLSIWSSNSVFTLSLISKGNEICATCRGS